MEFLGPYPLSHSHNWYIIFFIDHFTKYVEFIPVLDQMAATCAKVFVTRNIVRCSMPKFVISNRES